MPQQQSIVDIEQLQSIYNEGNYPECLEGTDLFLIFNPQDPEGLLLKAKCAYQLSYNNENADDLLAVAINSFEELLKLIPAHEEAMLYLAYINIFITGINLPESIEYCNELAASVQLSTRIKAITYRQEAYYQTDDVDSALKDLDLLIKLNKAHTIENRSFADHEQGRLYAKKANLYLEHKNDPAKALETFKEGLVHRYKDVNIYCLIANLALESEDYELGGDMARIALFSGSADADTDENLITLYYRLKELSRQGVINKPIIYAMFIALKIYPERLECDMVGLLNFAQHYIKIYPDWIIPYHYAGAVLYEAKSYSEALPYLQKSVELGGLALGLQRFIEVSYRINGQLPTIEKWPEDSAVMYYNAGVSFFYESESEISNVTIARDLLQMRVNFYKISYEGFYDYFYNDKGNGAANEPHIFAMCCNNYGIALRELGEYDKAVEVHKLGYTLSPFWEQLYSLGTALIALQRYEEAIEVLEQATAYSSEYLGFEDYIDLRGKQLTAIYGLGRKDEARELLTSIEEEYNSFIKTSRNDLTEQELFVLSQRYIVVQNIRQDLLGEASLEEATETWKDQLDKNPDDNSSWYMLMQNYYQLKDYNQCIACANNYQSVKGDAITMESIQKVYYVRGMSYLYLGDYVTAKENLHILLDNCQQGNESDKSIICDTNISLAQCSYALQQWDECMDFSLAAVACYDRNGWKWDKTWIKAALQYADGCKMAGENDAAIDTVSNILKVAPENEKALQRKREWKSGGLFSFFKRN
ncbi:tetratricopeptide repeat protein [Mucilaginibacter sabulilitoris]|uniref:Tetratricopeptide repeat protein n=1 Tax=Mucilaginibacter sabulilitoris TaxID=1173583 RepID=A0ABZ0THZ4_9SPHI|nr:tetratricopeptide repeat protein [Mucilaginibacter sabulilitoris]WPU92820.1 tetratricopeptide repeat protein [Mucilaginibacter sabulilitoris]